MKKLIAALALLMVISLTAAKAELKLYVATETISRAQAQALADRVQEALDEPVALLLQEDTGESIFQRIIGGEPVRLAVLPAPQAAYWAREGWLLPMDGCVSEISRMEEALVDVCVFDEQLLLAPLMSQRRMMALRPDRFEAVNMGYLLDARAHPVWYPSEFSQALDEMALLDRPGMDVWPPQEAELPAYEALLQGVSVLELVDEATGAYAASERTLAEGISWLDEMVRAGLIMAAVDREEALTRFLSGETAVFLDWTAAESQAYAKEIKREEIVLWPYPSLGGAKRHAAQLTVLCAFASQDEKENEQALLAASSILEGDGEQETLWRRSLYDDGAACLPLLGTRPYAPTLRALLREGLCGVIEGEVRAREAARRIDRAMHTAGFKPGG